MEVMHSGSGELDAPAEVSPLDDFVAHGMVEADGVSRNAASGGRGGNPSSSVRPLDPRNALTIVSGLPRSGTSMMMQMLAAAGLPIASDGRRAADEDNPRGYYELEAVRRLREDASFVAGRVGQTVKVIAPLLPFLPADYDYRVVFMERDLQEILDSQRAMLSRTGQGDHVMDDEALGPAFSRQLSKVKCWIDQRDNLRTCFVSHRQALAHPTEISAVVVSFLEETGALADELNGAETRCVLRQRMAAVVEPGLHRQRMA
ncbi:MAG: sulfotransferase family protein [Deltaproteobacteria bacterium]|jgi:hypothetical protein|nr:sulfotransferase family protein [Deltaproteobacteria bacterium]